MRALITFIAILTVGIVTAQSGIVVSQITHDNNPYTHIQGDDNGAENCFTAISSSTIVGNVNGLSVETISIDNVDYSWTGPGAEALAISFGSWDDYNRFYQNRGTQRPVRVADDLISCDGWLLGNDGQTYSNSAFADYTYNSFDIDPTVNHGNTLGAYIYHDGVRITFGGVASNREALESAIDAAINLHMNPIETPEEEEEDLVTGTWTEGQANGWFNGLSWRNPDYRGYHYRIISFGPNALPSRNAGKSRVEIGYDENWATNNFWTTTEVIGIGRTDDTREFTLYDNEQAAHNAARAFIHTRGADNLEIARGERYVISQHGTAFYVEITTQHDVLVIFRAFLDRDEAIAFATDPSSYPSPTSFTAADFVTTTHANPGWRRGVYQGGQAGYTITDVIGSTGQIEATWTWTDDTGVGHSGQDRFDVISTSEFVPLWLSVDEINAGNFRYSSLSDAHAAHPNRLDRDFFERAFHAPDDVTRAQDDAIVWAIDAINAFIVSHPSN